MIVWPELDSKCNRAAICEWEISVPLQKVTLSVSVSHQSQLQNISQKNRHEQWDGETVYSPYRNDKESAGWLYFPAWLAWQLLDEYNERQKGSTIYCTISKIRCPYISKEQWYQICFPIKSTYKLFLVNILAFFYETLYIHKNKQH